MYAFNDCSIVMKLIKWFFMPPENNSKYGDTWLLHGTDSSIGTLT